jgi:hypothetical protein
MKDIIAIAIDDKTLTDSQGRTCTPETAEQLFDFLMIDNPTEYYFVVWNLYQLVGLIRQFIPERDYLTLLEHDKVWTNGYKLFSSSGKKLSIKHEYNNHLHDNFYASKIVETDIYNLYKYFPNYQPENARDIKAKGIELLTTLETMGIQDPKTLASGIAIYADTVMSKASIPHLYDCPEEALDMGDYALQMMNREWRATYKIGRFPNATQIDINGCYPSLVKDFGDLSTAKYWHSKRYEPCDFGIFHGEVNIFGDTPIVNDNKQPIASKYVDYITTEQWGFLRKFGKGTFTPFDGWMLKFQDNNKPCEKIMTDLYQQRQQGGLVSDLSKSFSVGLIGQFSQYYDDKKGKFYNPIYSVMATSRASLKLGAKLEQLGLWSKLVYAIVDGAIVDASIQLGDGKRTLGDFRSEPIDTLVLSINHKYSSDKLKDMLKLIEKYPNNKAYNDIVLKQQMNTTNRIFNEYPATGKEWITNQYSSEPIEGIEK